MSKYVKNLLRDEFSRRLDGVGEALLVDISRLDANTNNRLRHRLREKDISLMVIRNSLARRATEGTSLAAAFAELSGPTAMVWGGTDIVALAKEITAIIKEKEYQNFEARGGVLDGEPLTSDDVTKISKWPSREEQLGILLAQINSPGAKLSAQLTSVGAMLASQVKKIADKEGGDGEDGDGGDTDG
ncbi:MAG: 50S ribosomal protein L10 [Pirellulales bacterium]|nr:50S ribosomal protein L10 [Planctomycetales bacterium]